MALGDKYDNNKKDADKRRSPTVYSKYGFGNKESKLDPTKLSITYWNGLLKLSIAPSIPNTQNFDYEKEGAIYLTHIKAKMFIDEIDIFLNDPNTYNNVGVSTNTGLVYISNGKEFGGSVVPCLLIRLMDEDGKITGSFLYEFKEDYHYTIRNFNEEDITFDKIYNNLLEIELLRSLLYDYYTAMSGAVAYSVQEYGKYDNSRTHTKLDSIAEKLGISYKKIYNKPNVSVFDKAEGRSYNATDLDDIENQM